MKEAGMGLASLRKLLESLPKTLLPHLILTAHLSPIPHPPTPPWLLPLSSPWISDGVKDAQALWCFPKMMTRKLSCEWGWGLCFTVNLLSGTLSENTETWLIPFCSHLALELLGKPDCYCLLHPSYLSMNPMEIVSYCPPVSLTCLTRVNQRSWPTSLNLGKRLDLPSVARYQNLCPYPKTVSRGQSNSSEIRVFVLHMTQPDSIPGIPSGSLMVPKVSLMSHGIPIGQAMCTGKETSWTDHSIIRVII